MKINPCPRGAGMHDGLNPCPACMPPACTREQLAELHALELKAARTLATWRRGLCIWDDVLVAADALIDFEAKRA